MYDPGGRCPAAGCHSSPCNNLIQMGRLRAEQLADGTPVIPLDAIEEYARQREQRLEGRTKNQPAKVASTATLRRRQSAPAQHSD